MHRRINISLPEETISLIDEVAENGNRSRFIDLAVKKYAEGLGRMDLKRRLKEGAMARAHRDRQLAEEWFAIEEEAWREQDR